MLRPLAVLTDYVEEGWTSMEYCAQMLIQHLEDGKLVRPVRICPTFRRRAQRVPTLLNTQVAFNVDRLFNRFWDYPRAARDLNKKFKYFHICDHSYAQLVHDLPPGLAGVYCHDLDAFRSLLEPRAEPRPLWFRSMMRRVLGGLSRAAVVFCSTELLRRQIAESGIVGPGRIVLAPYGVADEFRPGPAGADAHLPLPFDRDVPFLLHVGTTIPRKRVDVLLDTFARARSRVSGLRLVQVGGSWTRDQRDRIARLGIGADLTQLRGIERTALAALYRHAAVVLLPSRAEGFGLPVVEALASGAVVVASDLPALREVGGEAAVFGPVGDPAAWSGIVVDLLEGRSAPPPRDVRLARAARYSWAGQARTIAEAYLALPERPDPSRRHQKGS